MRPISTSAEALACVGLGIDIALFVDELPAEITWMGTSDGSIYERQRISNKVWPLKKQLGFLMISSARFVNNLLRLHDI